MLRILCLSLILAFSLPSFAQMRRGGMSDGGGCLIHRPKQPSQLLDMAFTGQKLPQHLAGDKIEVNKMMISIGVSPVDIRKLKSFELAQSLVKKWLRNDDVWAVYLDSVLTHLHRLTFFGGTYRFTAAPQSYCEPYPANLQSGSIVRPVVVFKEESLILSVLDFNEMDLYSQAGVWIHEGFRAMQILMKDPIPNEIVYRITSDILSGVSTSIRLQDRYKPVGSVGRAADVAILTKEASQKLCVSIQKNFIYSPGLVQTYNNYCRNMSTQGFSKEQMDELDKICWDAWYTPFSEIAARYKAGEIDHNKAWELSFTAEMRSLQRLREEALRLRRIMAGEELSRPGVYIIFMLLQKNHTNPIWQELALGSMLDYAEFGAKQGARSAQQKEVRQELELLRQEWRHRLKDLSY